MDLGLAGKVAIVTGGTANIGRGIVLALAAEGAKVLFTGRDAEAGARLKALATGSGFLQINMLEADAGIKTAEAASALGDIAVLVNNVGGNSSKGLFVDTDPADWLGDYEINMGAMLRMTHAVLPGMIARKAGAIVNLGSTAGIVKTAWQLWQRTAFPRSAATT